MSKKILAWAVVFALVLSTLPYTAAVGATEEWFQSWDYELEDRDGDDAADLIIISFNPDTNSTEEIEVYVEYEVHNADGEYIGDGGDSFEITYNETDDFELDWGPDDCYYDDEECEGPYTFYVNLYDDGWNHEDDFSISNITLYKPGMPDDVIQVDGGPFAWEDDGIHNDAVARAMVLDYYVANVTYELEKFVQGVWIDAGNATTDDSGFAAVFNQTNGLYRWTAFYENEEIDSGEFVLQASASNNLGHIGAVEDDDGDDDYDDFYFFLAGDDDDDSDEDFEVYAEVYYEDNNTLYTSGSGEQDLTFFDVPEGNYTFDLYYEEDGNLLQQGWMHSYGSETDHTDYWFQSYNHTTEDSNGDGVNNNVTITYDPDTNSGEEEDIRVEIHLYDNDGNGDYYEYEYEITGNETDNFESDVITVRKDGNYTFEVWLYDDDWYDHDYFDFEEYLECDEDYTECDDDEWFEDWDYDLVDTDGDNLADTIDVFYNPDTTCDCGLDVNVNIDIFESDSGDWIDDEYSNHYIYGTDQLQSY